MRSINERAYNKGKKESPAVSRRASVGLVSKP